MISIKIKFNYNGKKYKFAAVLTDSFKLSSNTVNRGTICETDPADIWSLFFCPENDHVFEVVFHQDKENGPQLDPFWINVWDMEDDGKLVDEFGYEEVKCTVKRY